MDIAAIGVGGAGGTLVNRLVGRHGSDSPIVSAAVIDTDRESLDTAGNIPAESRHAIGQFETGGEGTDGNRERATELVEDQQMEIRRMVEDGISTTVDAVVLFAGLGGGTGSGVTPAIAADLAEVYEQPVYTVSILPAESETDMQIRANTAAALSELTDTVEAQIVLDNDAWLWGSRTLESHGRAINREFVSRLTAVLTVSRTGVAADVGERVVDASDIKGTVNDGGMVAIGYASSPLSKWRNGGESMLGSLKRRISGDQTDNFARATALRRTLEWAARGTLTVECPPDGARRGLVAFSGPPDWLRRDAIASGRDWLVECTGVAELRSGDTPCPSASSISVLVVLAGITDTPRIQEFVTAE